VGDVGEAAWEEVDYEPAGRGGRNYGWPSREAAHSHVNGPPAFSQPLTDPVFEYTHDQGHSITGGFIYRGTALGSSFRGRYFFGDFIDGRVSSLRLTVNPSTGEATSGDLIEHTADLGAAATNVVAFVEDASGELYIVSYFAGAVYRIGSTVPPPTDGGRLRPPSVPAIGFAVPRTGATSAAPPSAKAVAARATKTAASLSLFERLLARDPAAAAILVAELMDAISRGETIDDRWLAEWLVRQVLDVRPPGPLDPTTLTSAH